MSDTIDHIPQTRFGRKKKGIHEMGQQYVAHWAIKGIDFALNSVNNTPICF